MTQISSGFTNIRPNSVVMRNVPCCGTIQKVIKIRRKKRMNKLPIRKSPSALQKARSSIELLQA
jgi:hypothetical protein